MALQPPPVAGRRNREIADLLVISQATVKTHVKQILRKHGAANRSQVIAHHHGAVRVQNCRTTVE